jgi:hypothetical protein
VNQVIPAGILSVITFFSPFLSAVINRYHWGPRLKNGVAFGVALVIAVGYLLATGHIGNGPMDVAVVSTVFAFQQLVYKQILSEVAGRVEVATYGKGLVVNTAAPKDSAGHTVIVVSPVAPAPAVAAPVAAPEAVVASPTVVINSVEKSVDGGEPAAVTGAVETVSAPVAAAEAGSAPADNTVAVKSDERFVMQSQTPAKG